MQSELHEGSKLKSEMNSEVASPRLQAILFCDWANRTQDNKTNLIGTFDRIFMGGKSRITPRFFMYLRLLHTSRGPVRIRIVEPDGEIGLEGMIEFAQPLPNEEKPDNVEVILPMQFEVEKEGLHWFDIAYQDQTLGGAPLVVQFVDIADSDAEGGREHDLNN